MTKRIVFKNTELEDEIDDLGSVHYEGHSYTPIPGWKEELTHPIFISRQFESHANNRWKVNAIEFVDGNIEINLTGITQTKSLGAISGSNDSKLTQIVSQYCIVEVDFGHHSLFTSPETSGFYTNKIDCDTNLPGELHKRRPCIVLQIHSKTIQVIPLSSRENNEPHSIEISPDSFRKLNHRYSKQSCYTLPHMITSVSAYRVYPPSLPPSGKSHYGAPTTLHKYKISSGDRDKLKKSLASQYAPAAANQRQLLENQIQGLKNEKVKLLDRLSNTKGDLDNLRAQVKDLGNKWEEFGSAEEIIKKISPD